MSVDKARLHPPSASVFMPFAAISPEPIGVVEGTALAGEVVVRPLMVSADALLLHFFRSKGVRDPEHVHHDHDTVCHLLSGRLRLCIGGEIFEAGPGDSWHHPRGVVHWSEALEDSVQVEVKSPPVKTWRSPVAGS
jgi:quercetin dioxygenase-like cupin family protein